MIDPLPPPVTLLSHETVESGDVAVLTFTIKAVKVRGLFTASQIDFAADFFAGLKLRMKEAKRISAAP